MRCVRESYNLQKVPLEKCRLDIVNLTYLRQWLPAQIGYRRFNGFDDVLTRVESKLFPSVSL